MPDEHYVTPRLSRLYDLSSPWSRERQFYLDLAAGAGMRVLDVGCGTGLLTVALASGGNQVTGVDPAKAMLDVARARPGGERVEWVECAAEDYERPTTYDLIIMTGNAFQALLEARQVAAFFRHCRDHLSRGGSLVFETRNPDLDWPARWDYEAVLQTEEGPCTESREFVDLQRGRMTFDLHYAFPGETLTSRSRIRFWTRAEVRDLAGDAGLEIVSQHGGWEREVLDPRSSDEMIFVLGRAAER